MNGLIAEFAMVRSVRDAARLLDAVAGSGPGDPYDVTGPTDFAGVVAAPPTGLRIGLHPVGEHPAAAEVVRATGDALERIGHHVEESHPVALDEGDIPFRLFEVVTAFVEFALGWWERALGEPLTADDVEPLNWWLAEQSRRSTPGQYLATVEWIQAWARRTSRWWEDGFDLLVTPTMSAPPPAVGHRFDPDTPISLLLEATAAGGRCMEWNLTGSPAISLPVGVADGLPMGVQLVGARGSDRLVLGVAAQLEAALPWAGRRPPGW